MVRLLRAVADHPRALYHVSVVWYEADARRAAVVSHGRVSGRGCRCGGDLGGVFERGLAGGRAVLRFGLCVRGVPSYTRRRRVTLPHAGGSTSNDDRPDLQEVPRPKFQAQTRRLSPVTNTNEAWFDPRIRTRRIVLSWFVVLLCCGLQLALLFGVFQVEALAIRDKSVSPILAIAWVACGLSAAAAIDSRLFKHVARYLTSYENHTYQPDHEAHLVAKRFAFEAVNQFGPVRFSAFVVST